MIYGKGTPRIIANGTVFDLPLPLEGGRIVEEETKETEEFLDWNNEIVEGTPRYRFNGEYKIYFADKLELSRVSDKLRTTRLIEFYPYNDISMKFTCIFRASIINIKNKYSKGLYLVVKATKQTSTQYSYERMVVPYLW